jgi:hypothetical protein
VVERSQDLIDRGSGHKVLRRGAESTDPPNQTRQTLATHPHTMGRQQTKRPAPPKHKTAKKAKAKQTQGPSAKPRKSRQTRLPFAPASNDTGPKVGGSNSGGGWVEPFPTPESSSLVAVVVSTPTNHDRYQYYNASPVPFPRLSMSPHPCAPVLM